MFKNYVKVSIRNILKFKVYSIINIVGLAVGMACCILIMLWVTDELSYDNFHQNKDYLFRVTKTNLDKDGVPRTLTPMPLGPALKDKYSEIVAVTRLSINGPKLITHGDIKYQDDIMAIADPDFLNMFSFPLIEGDSKTALNDKFSVIISESMKDKYFGDTDPLGQVLTIDRRDFTVTGIMKNIPHNSHMQFDFLLPFQSMRQYLFDVLDNWKASAFYTYVMLLKTASPEEVQQKIASLINDNNRESEHTIQLGLQPIEKIYLHYDVEDYLENKGNIKYVYLFSILAFLILLIASMNFMNLSTARAGTRIKEIGVRKVIGAGKTDLLKQFIGESLLFSFFAFMIAIAITESLLPLFNGWFGKALNLSDLGIPTILFGSMTFILLSGILAGGYPALFLSSFLPVRIFKETQISFRSGSSLRKGLVIFQFIISVFLIITAGAIYNQLIFIQNKDLGYDKEQMLYVQMRGSFAENYETIREALMQDPSFIDITGGDVPIEISNPAIDVSWGGKPETDEEDDNDIVWQCGHVSNNFIETYGMKLIMGESFLNKNQTLDAAGFIVNETAVKLMGLESPIGQNISFKSYEDDIVPKPHGGYITGVIKDFHNSSLREMVNPMILVYDPGLLYSLSARVKAGENDRAINLLKTKWNEYSPEYPFEFGFIDETLNNFYRSEHRLAEIFAWSFWLAIFISCMGLFGLASFAAERRKKEISVRKILGASLSNVIGLLIKEIMILVTISIIIAWPVAYYSIDNWLENFAYSMNISWELFVLATVLVVIIAFLAVLGQAIKTARCNPAANLKYE